MREDLQTSLPRCCARALTSWYVIICLLRILGSLPEIQILGSKFSATNNSRLICLYHLLLHKYYGLLLNTQREKPGEGPLLSDRKTALELHVRLIMVLMEGSNIIYALIVTKTSLPRVDSSNDRKSARYCVSCSLVDSFVRKSFRPEVCC